MRAHIHTRAHDRLGIGCIEVMLEGYDSSSSPEVIQVRDGKDGDLFMPGEKSEEEGEEGVPEVRSPGESVSGDNVGQEAAAVHSPRSDARVDALVSAETDRLKAEAAAHALLAAQGRIPMGGPQNSHQTEALAKTAASLSETAAMGGESGRVRKSEVPMFNKEPPVDERRESSPEKRARLRTDIPVHIQQLPHFGVSLTPAGKTPRPIPTSAPTGAHPPALAAGGATSPYPVLQTTPVPGSERKTQHFALTDPEPDWVQGLKTQLREVGSTQTQILAECGHTAKEVQRLGKQYDGMFQEVKHHSEQIHAQRVRIETLEREVQEMKSRPTSPAPVSPRHLGGPPGLGSGGGSSPRAPSSISERPVDDLQLVMGGWYDARRADIETEVRALFAEVQASALLKSVHVPYVRANFCRIDILYPNESLGAKRILQSTIIAALKPRMGASRIEGQGGQRLWITRNRSASERAKVRAIVSVKDFATQRVGAANVEMDWSGKLWIRGRNVLFHASYPHVPNDPNPIRLRDAKGNESGWILLGDLAARLMSETIESIKEYFAPEASA